MKLDLQFEQNQQNINVPFSESGGQFNANFGETSVLHDGQNGATFTPSVSNEGVISWTNDRELPNPDPVNIRGKDGRDGVDGKDGYTPKKGVDYFDGKDGKDGTNGKDGYTPIKGKDYFDGANGKDGKDGEDGYTPVKGKDYFTDADKSEMVQNVISALPVYNGEVTAV